MSWGKRMAVYIALACFPQMEVAVAERESAIYGSLSVTGHLSFSSPLSLVHFFLAYPLASTTIPLISQYHLELSITYSSIPNNLGLHGHCL
jgi:hypothetical protein